MEQIPPVVIPTAQPSVPPYKLAFVIDNKAVLIANVDAKSASVFVSNPTVIQVEITDPVQEGWVYDGTSFSNPEK
jgi:phenylpyruvate tautomerase PptA (4-oxalocrotonate tautomerase family)